MRPQPCSPGDGSPGIRFLFSSIVSAVAELANELSASDIRVGKKIHSERERLLLWGHSVSATNDDLDQSLSGSEKLRSQVLGILYLLGESVMGCVPPRIHLLGRHRGYKQLKDVLDARGKKLQHAAKGAKDTELLDPSDREREGLKAISAYIDCLMDLSTVLEKPPKDSQIKHIERELRNPWTQKTALGFDGGGVRGYWSLLVLQTLMKEIQRQEKELEPCSWHSFHPCESPALVSHMPVEQFTPFLPCHYFDYIGGTSSGALISIMLSRFRMTVEDCMDEYETMAGKMFGRPRQFNAVWNPLTERSKFSSEDLKGAIRDVIRRRAEGTHHIPDLENVLFKTEFGTCRGLVFSLEDGSPSNKPVRIRSYVYNPHSHYNQTSSNRSSVQLNNAVMSVDMAARAATAAFLYLDRPQIKISRDQHMQRIATSYQPTEKKMSHASAFFISRFRKESNESSPEQMTITLSDAGFGRYNNPCEEIIGELDELHEKPNITLVSIGTARPERMATRKWRLTEFAKTAVEGHGDPERVHQSIEGLGKSRIDYLRLNSPGGLKLGMDDWRPKKSGQDTLNEIRGMFQRWVNDERVINDMARYAEKLVQLRRQRAAGDEDKWKSFALGQYYICSDNDCEGEDHKFRARADFEAHLTKEHTSSRMETEDKVATGTRTWEYRPSPKHRATTFFPYPSVRKSRGWRWSPKWTNKGKNGD